jgi:molybdopterin adenylyltransferase
LKCIFLKNYHNLKKQKLFFSIEFGKTQRKTISPLEMVGGVRVQILVTSKIILKNFQQLIQWNPQEFSLPITCNISSVMSNNHIRSFEITGAVITVSTTRTTNTDTSGKTISGFLEEKSIPVRHYSIVPDRIDSIRNEVYIAVKKANCIIINGGTGLTHDDCTIEAVSPLLDKKIEGFGEFFRMKSIQQIGTASMLSRAVAGIINGKAVFCIPGSTPAVTLATTELILPEIAHILSHANR